MRVFCICTFLLLCIVACDNSKNTEKYELEVEIICDDLIQEKRDFLENYLDKKSNEKDEVDTIADSKNDVDLIEYLELENYFILELSDLNKANTVDKNYLYSFKDCYLKQQVLQEMVSNIRAKKEGRGVFSIVIEFLFDLMLEVLFVGGIVFIFVRTALTDKPKDLFRALYSNWLVIIVFALILLIARPLHRLGVIADSLDKEIENIVDANIEETKLKLEQVTEQNLKILENERD